MNFKCIELEGCLFQPKSIIEFNNYWIISACKKANSLTLKDQKLILSYSDHIKIKENKQINFFVLCYEFLFPEMSIYSWYSTAQNYNSFFISGLNIDDVEMEIKKRYATQGGITIDFNRIGACHTNLPDEINFKSFHDRFVDRYESENKFKEIIMLFLYTIGFKHKLYDNILQKIAQLQTIFETLLGKPKVNKCDKCHTDKYIEEWPVYLHRKLNRYNTNISEDEISLIIKVKTTLNRLARVKYIHHSEYLNTSEKMTADLLSGRYDKKIYSSSVCYVPDLNGILKNNDKEWQSADWEHIFYIYQNIVKKVIYLMFLR
jgi:hypothetical protein